MQFTSKYLFLTFCLFASSVIFAQHNIIPTPVKYENTSGMFMLDNQTAVQVNTKDESVTKMAQSFVDFLSKAGTKVELLKNVTDKHA